MLLKFPVIHPPLDPQANVRGYPMTYYDLSDQIFMIWTRYTIVFVSEALGKIV